MKKIAIIIILILSFSSCSYIQNKQKEIEWQKTEAEKQKENEQQYAEYLKYKHKVDSVKQITKSLHFKTFEIGKPFSICLDLSKNDTSLHNAFVKTELAKLDSYESAIPVLPQIVHYSAITHLFEPPLEFELNIYSIDDTIFSIKLSADYFKTDSCKYFKNGCQYSRTEYHKSKYFDKIYKSLVQQYSKKYGERIPSNYEDFHFEYGWETFNKSLFEDDCKSYCWEFKNGAVSLKRDYSFSTRWYEYSREQRSILANDMIFIEYIDSIQNKKIENICSLRKKYWEKFRETEKQDAERRKQLEENKFNESKDKILDNI